MKAIHEHEFEAAPGLPTALPKNEVILWQGSPDWVSLAVHAFHVRKIAIYFSIMICIQWINVYEPDQAISTWLMPCLTSAFLALLSLSCILGWAWLSSKTTLYTITDKRLVLRVGIVLSLTFNLPYKRIQAADLRPLAKGCGDISLKLPEGDQIGFFHLWPHARAWELRQPQPTLRCVPEAARVSDTLANAWTRQTNIAMPVVPSQQSHPTLVRV